MSDTETMTRGLVLAKRLRLRANRQPGLNPAQRTAARAMAARFEAAANASHGSLAPPVVLEQVPRPLAATFPHQQSQRRNQRARALPPQEPV